MLASEGGDLRVNGWPVAVDLFGAVRESARLRNSEEVIALWFFTFSATGPVQHERSFEHEDGRVCRGELQALSVSTTA